MVDFMGYFKIMKPPGPEPHKGRREFVCGAYLVKCFAL